MLARRDPSQEARRLVVADKAQAEGLCAEIARALETLRSLLEEESALLSAGQVRAALSLEERKKELAAGYFRGLEAAKANMVALARLVPDRVAELKSAQTAFRAVVEHNLAVIGTARAVSEGLIRGVAEEMARQARPSGYGRPNARPAAVQAGPLLVSTHL